MDISWTFHGHFMDISWTFHGIMQPEWQGFGDKSFENEAIGDVEVEGPLWSSMALWDCLRIKDYINYIDIL